MTRLRTALLALVLATCVGASCFNPVKLSNKCKRMISECLADCPEPLTRPDIGDKSDERTVCERRCHGMCSS